MLESAVAPLKRAPETRKVTGVTRGKMRAYSNQLRRLSHAEPLQNMVENLLSWRGGGMKDIETLRLPAVGGHRQIISGTCVGADRFLDE